MSDLTYKTHEDLYQELKKDPDFEKESRRLEPYYAVARDVFALRKEMNLTQAELAEKSGTHQTRISKIESAELDIRLSTLIKVADALDAMVDVRIVPNQEDFDYLLRRPITVQSVPSTVTAELPAKAMWFTMVTSTQKVKV